MNGRSVHVIVLVLALVGACGGPVFHLTSPDNDPPALTTALSAAFFVVSAVFVYRSFYGMRIESKD